MFFISALVLLFILKTYTYTYRSIWYVISGKGGWFLIFIVQFFFLIEFHCTFSLSYKTMPYCFIIIVLSLGSDRPSAFFFLDSLTSYLLRLFLQLISFLLLPCTGVWANTRAWVPISYSHIQWYLMFLSFGTRENKHALTATITGSAPEVALKPFN